MKLNKIRYTSVAVGDLILITKGNSIIRFIKRLLDIDKDLILACTSDGALLLDRACEVYRTRKCYSKEEKMLFRSIIDSTMNKLCNRELIFIAVNTVRYDTLTPEFKTKDIQLNKYYKKIY